MIFLEDEFQSWEINHQYYHFPTFFYRSDIRVQTRFEPSSYSPMGYRLERSYGLISQRLSPTLAMLHKAKTGEKSRYETAFMCHRPGERDPSVRRERERSAREGFSVFVLVGVRRLHFLALWSRTWLSGVSSLFLQPDFLAPHWHLLPCFLVSYSDSCP